MIRRIELHNFMSHAHTVVELAEGLTVLVGENNCGKSAVVSALQILCQNTSGDFMVRHGEKECVVKAETDDGHVLEWRRKGGAVSYTLDGQDVHRLRGSVPEELHALLRLPVVESEGGDFDVHFGEQKKPIFLLDQSANRRATFFASSSDSIKLIEMQNLHRRKMQQAKVEERNLIKQEAALDRRLKSLAPLTELQSRLEQLEMDCKTISNAVNKLALFRQTLKRLHRATHNVDLCTAQTRAMDGLTVPPKLTPTVPLRVLVQRLAQVTRQVRLNGAVATATEPLAQPPRFVNTRKLSDLIARITQVQKDRIRSTKEKDALGCLTPAPAFVDLESLRRVISRIEETKAQASQAEAISDATQLCVAPPQLEDLSLLQQVVKRIESAEAGTEAVGVVLASLTDLCKPPEPVDLAPLTTTIRSLEMRQETVQEAERTAREAKGKLDKAERELRQQAEQVGICPTCGQELDPDKLVQVASSRESMGS